MFQQYIEDQYYKVESERLSFIRQNQQLLHAADYTSLCEQLGDVERVEDEAKAVRAGPLLILSSTYVEGVRYMRQNMHDIILISNRLGHPEIFLTMTCNPKWPEITRDLIPGQKPQDRPDICARVFPLKLWSMMSFVIE